MINIPAKEYGIQEKENSGTEGSFDDKTNKEGLNVIEKVKKQESRKQKEEEIILKKDLFTHTPKKDMKQKEKRSIARIPPPDTYYTQRKDIKVDKLPSFDPSNKYPYQIDGFCYDLSNVDVEKNIDILNHASFDTKTKRPENINNYFNPEKTLELGKNPGLHIRELHERGITGKNIGIAVIDQALLVDHKEYKDQIKVYEEMDDIKEKCAKMHGCTTLSIAAGKNTGVAPDTDIYYIGGKYAEEIDGNISIKLDKIARAIDKITKENAMLDEKHKIRVISISYGGMKNMGGYKTFMVSIKKAEEQGIYVIYTGDKHFIGAGRNPDKNPDTYESYTKGFYRENDKKNFIINFMKKIVKNRKERILIPMDSRSTASPTGDNDYMFHRYGGMSRAVPYVAGIYALCCQVKKNINKDSFWKAVHQTAEEITIENEKFKIINPTKLIEHFEKTTITP